MMRLAAQIISERPTTRQAIRPHSDAANDPHDFTSLSSIRRRFGKGWGAYESAKCAWWIANPNADYQQGDAAMCRIARAVGV